MSQSAPGWYQDHDDPRLARWWDGERWTEHTLVLDEQDWSTEPEPPATRFPVDTGSVTAVEPNPGDAGFEEDIYAPIRDPWGEEEAAAEEPPTQAWPQPEDPWAGTAAGAAAGAAATGAAWGEDDYRWPGEDPGRRGGLGGRIQDWPTWAKVAVPLAIVAVVLLGFALAGALGGDDEDPVSTASTSTSIASLGDAAQAALAAAGDGPFTTSTFTTLIPLACQAADDDAPTLLTDRIGLLGYDAATISKLVTGLETGTEEYCPDKMDQAPGLLDQVESTAIGGATTSSSIDVTSTSEATATTKGSTTTTKPKPKTTTSTSTTTTTTTTTTVEETTTSSSTTSTTEPLP